VICIVKMATPQIVAFIQVNIVNGGLLGRTGTGEDVGKVLCSDGRSSII
jgi:hypothetical protein